MRHRGACPATRHRAGASEERSLSGNARFLGSFPRADVVLEAPLPEIAFLGRSNVGKSSLLNAVVGQRIARISATPGKTTALNVYEIPVRGAWGVGAADAPRTTPQALYLLDLPGYGYARASHTDRAGFRGLLTHVVKRARLAGVVWLLDIRRDPSADDRAMQDVFIQAGTRVLAALTKADKLPRGQRLERGRALRADLELPEDQIVMTSAKTGDGMDELREAMMGLIQ